MQALEKATLTIAVCILAAIAMWFITSHTTSLAEQVTGELTAVQDGSWEGSGIGGH